MKWSSGTFPTPPAVRSLHVVGGDGRRSRTDFYARAGVTVTNDSLGASEVGFVGKESTGDGDTETATSRWTNAAVFTEDGRVSLRVGRVCWQ